MGTTYKGTFVISWSQTTIDTLQAAPTEFLKVGAAWSWTGDAVRVDGPNSLLRLDEAEGDAERRKAAARMVRRLVGAAIEETETNPHFSMDFPMADKCFVLTDGGQTFTVTLVDSGPRTPPLLMFLNDIPPRDSELWIVHTSLDTVVSQNAAESEAQSSASHRVRGS